MHQETKEYRKLYKIFKKLDKKNLGALTEEDLIIGLS